jgi:galactokinase/mevalonate kinase-like predicted kinase
MKHNGAVVGGTIDKYIYVILSKRFDDKIVVGYSKQEEVDNVKTLLLLEEDKTNIVPFELVNRELPDIFKETLNKFFHIN